MNVTQENIDELNARVKIEIGPEDYEGPVTKILNDYRKKMTLQGFRPVRCHLEWPKKMYGKAVLAEELNKMLSENLNGHIRGNELDILGQPLPERSGRLVFRLQS